MNYMPKHGGDLPEYRLDPLALVINTVIDLCR